MNPRQPPKGRRSTSMKIVVLKDTPRSRPGICPWLIDLPSQD
jgi:hypothetical protein